MKAGKNGELEGYDEIVVVFGVLVLLILGSIPYGYFFYTFTPICALFTALYLYTNAKHKGKTGFGMRHTAEEVSEGVDLTGKVAVVTGSTSGIGYETARVLALRGAHVILASRNVKKLEKTQKDLETELARVGCKAKFTSIKLDLNSLKSVNEFVEEFKKLNLPLNILVNNAGIMALKTRQETEEGIEKQMGVDHVSHHYLSVKLVPYLKRGAPSRVVCLTSSAHGLADVSYLNSEKLESKSYHPWTAYGNAKFSNILFAREFNKRYSKEGIKGYSVHPGGIHTGLQTYVSPYLMFKWTLVTPFFFKSIQQGASTTILCAVNDVVENLDGNFFDNCNVGKPLENVADSINDKSAALLWDRTEKLIKSAGF